MSVENALEELNPEDFFVIGDRQLDDKQLKKQAKLISKHGLVIRYQLIKDISKYKVGNIDKSSPIYRLDLEKFPNITIEKIIYVADDKDTVTYLRNTDKPESKVQLRLA